jgi:hypothetical protein
MTLLEETASVDCHLKDEATSYIYLLLDFLEGFLAFSLVGAISGWKVMLNLTGRYCTKVQTDQVMQKQFPGRKLKEYYVK